MFAFFYTCLWLYIDIPPLLYIRLKANTKYIYSQLLRKIAFNYLLNNKNIAFLKYR